MPSFPSSFNHRWWLNLCGFQLLWWGCVLLGNTFVLPALSLLLLHLWFHPHRKPEAISIVLCSSIGMGVDTLLIQQNVLQLNQWPPVWLALLWLGFCATLSQGLAFLPVFSWITVVLGGTAGSSSYLAAAALGAAQLPLGYWHTAALLTLIWSLLLPLLLHLSRLVHQHYGRRSTP